MLDLSPQDGQDARRFAGPPHHPSTAPQTTRQPKQGAPASTAQPGRRTRCAPQTRTNQPKAAPLGPKPASSALRRNSPTTRNPQNPSSIVPHLNERRSNPSPKVKCPTASTKTQKPYIVGLYISKRRFFLASTSPRPPTGDHRISNLRCFGREFRRKAPDARSVDWHQPPPRMRFDFVPTVESKSLDFMAACLG
jgi:hypothetical protein